MRIAADLIADINNIQRGQNASHALRHLANEVDLTDSAMMKAGGLHSVRSILRIIQTHVTTREDRGQVCTYEDLMAIQIKGEGKEADRDLYHFYGEWMRVTLEMEKPHKSFRPSLQSHFYKQMKKCSCMAMTLVMYDNSNDTYGKGMKSYEWMLGRIANQMLKDPGEDSRRIQQQQINKRGATPSGEKAGGGNKDSLTMKDGRLKKSVVCRRWSKGQCPLSWQECMYLRPTKAATASQQKSGETQVAMPGPSNG
eukprot:1553809-Pyramimonas_sp.AAC.1